MVSSPDRIDINIDPPDPVLREHSYRKPTQRRSTRYRVVRVGVGWNYGEDINIDDMSGRRHTHTRSMVSCRVISKLDVD